MTNYYVITRSYMEDCYLDCFIEHYINLKFTKIIILKSDNTNYNVPVKYKNNVIIYNVKNEGNLIYNNNIHLYKNLNGWFLFIDVDEFLVLHSKYNNNINNFISNIKNLNNNVNIIFFRWAMIEKYNNNTNGINIKNIIKNYYKYKNEHIKSMVKSNVFVNIENPHNPNINTNSVIYFENKFIHNNNSRQLLNNNSYLDCYLIHIHTRSIINIITKSLNSYTNMWQKQIKNKNDFIKYINDKTYLESKNHLNDFKNLIGLKATLPFSHTNNSYINIKFPNLNYDSNLIDIYKEKKMLENYCNKNNINIINLNEFMNILNKYGNHLFKNSDFNWEKYINNYIDLKERLSYNRESALQHYLNNGIKENRKYT
jgi:hypothetical protein